MKIELASGTHYAASKVCIKLFLLSLLSCSLLFLRSSHTDLWKCLLVYDLTNQGSPLRKYAIQGLAYASLTYTRAEGSEWDPDAIQYFFKNTELAIDYYAAIYQKQQDGVRDPRTESNCEFHVHTLMEENGCPEEFL